MVRGMVDKVKKEKDPLLASMPLLCFCVTGIQAGIEQSSRAQASKQSGRLQEEAFEYAPIWSSHCSVAVMLEFGERTGGREQLRKLQRGR
jgi:hypothetical protein